MSESNMRKLSTLKLPKIPERYEVIDAKARKSIEGLEKTTSTHGKDIETLKSTVSTQGTSISTLTSTSTELQNDVSGLQDHFSSEMKEVSGDIIQVESMAGNVLRPVTVLEPKQEGCGDPYPAGGGKNLIPPSEITKHSTNNIRAFFNNPFTLKAGQPYTFSASHMATGIYIGKFNNDGSANSSEWLARRYEATAVTYTPDADIKCWLNAIYNGEGGAPEDVTLQFERGSTATPYAPYENIRPITGWDKLNLNHAGENLFNPHQTYEYFSDSTVEEDVISTNFLSNGVLRVKEGDVHPAGTYTLSIVPISGFEGFVAWLYYADNNEEKQISPINASNLTATIVADRPFKIGFGGIYRSPEHTCSYKVKLELGSATPYTSYQGKLHTVQIGETVYGGRFDWLTGKLVADIPMMVEFDGDEVVSTDGGGIFTTGAFGAASEAYGEILCSHYTSVRDYESFMNTDMSVCVWASGQIRIHDSRFNSVSEINAYYAAEKAAGTPVQIAYKRATPIEIQLTPTQILALQGTNTLYGDGTISLSSKGDILGVVDRVTSMEQTLFDTKEYEYNGSIVQFDAPLEGSPIEAVTAIAVKQEGSGDPYPAGGGKNLFPAPNEDETFTAGDFQLTRKKDGTIILNGTVNSLFVYYLPLSKGIPAGQTYSMSLNNPATNREVTLRVLNMPEYQEGGVFSNTFCRGDTVNAVATASESFDALGVQVRVAEGITLSNFEIKPQVELGNPSTYATYSNIRPISGYDALRITEAGLNLAPPHPVKSFPSNSGLSYSMTDGVLKISGTATTNVRLDTNKFTLPAGTYTLQPNASSPVNIAFYLRGNDGSKYGSVSPSKTATAAGTVNLSKPTEVCISVYISSGDTIDHTFAIQLTAGTLRLPYAPYQGKLHTVQIDQTVYGGRIDWNTGKLVAEWGVYVLPDEENNVYHIHDVSGRGTGKALVVWLDDIVDAGDLLFTGTFTAEVFSDYGVSDLNKLHKIKVWQAYHTSTALGIMVSADATAESVRAKLAGTKIAYKLANPIEIQLTSQDLTTLRGMNTIYSDAGETSISVRKDIFSLLSHLTRQNKELKATIEELQS